MTISALVWYELSLKEYQIAVLSIARNIPGNTAKRVYQLAFSTRRLQSNV